MTPGTIYALSSGSPPAAIAVIRISGPYATAAASSLAGSMPPPRRASLRTLRDPRMGEVLDNGLLLFFPGPGSATGEDLVELHLHGGRSVIAGVLESLSAIEELRAAQPGEFTRRAFENGRIDLAEAEGLADLLAAETQAQRRAALALAGGALSRRIEGWQSELLLLSAQVEAHLDFSDEGEVAENLAVETKLAMQNLADEVGRSLHGPRIERLRDGTSVVIAGPPNSGKSSLFNRIVGRQAAITSPFAGTTRDVIEAPVAIEGRPFLLIDTAGLRESADAIEANGIELAHQRLQSCDLILWLGDAADVPDSQRAIRVGAKADLFGPAERPDADVHVSVQTGEGLDDLLGLLGERSRSLLPGEGEIAINARHRVILSDVADQLSAASVEQDIVLVGEALRLARAGFDQITGRAGVEPMLDRLFSGFCIGK